MKQGGVGGVRSCGGAWADKIDAPAPSNHY